MDKTLRFKDFIQAENLFRIGILTLASAPSLASIFFLIAILSVKNSDVNFFEDKWNIPLIISSFFMIIGLVYLNTNVNSSILKNQWDSNLSLLGLFNWIPFFWFFWKCQNFLKSAEQRRKCAIFFIVGTFPVLISGFGQFYFGWEGPLELFNGFIIWYQRPLKGISGMTGMFNNPNYTGAWLSFIIPFTLASFQEDRKSILIRASSFLNFAMVFLGLIITYSRSAWICSFVALFFQNLEKKFLKFIKIFFIFLLFIIPIFFVFKENILFLVNKIIPSIFLSKFNQESFKNLDLMRVEIWGFALRFIFQRPIFGWGSGYFPLALENETGVWKGHPHNLILEVYFNFGIIVGSILLIFVLTLITKSFKNIFIRKIPTIYDRAWFTSALTLLTSQLVDQQYFDMRISLSIWILLAGLRNIIREQQNL